MKSVRRWSTRLIQLGLGMACIALLAAYAAKTYFRNWDWMSEDDLFISAQKVSGGGQLCQSADVVCHRQMFMSLPSRDKGLLEQRQGPA